MKKKAIYSGIVWIIVFFLAVGLVGSVTESEVTRLNDSPELYQHLDWKPYDSSKIVFESERTGNREIWAIDSNGGYLKQVTDETEREWAGSWKYYNESLITPPSKKKRIVVLANSIDFELATEFFGFLGNKGMETVHATASDIEQYKEEKFIVILGGPDAPEGIGEIVQNITSLEEQEAIREKGSRKKYVRTNMWTQGQRVTIIAGSDRNETKNSEDENQDSVVSEAESSS